MGSQSCRCEYMFVCWEVEDEVEVSLERVLHFREQKEEYRILGVGVVDLEMQVALVN
jgi:hypothetical protein